MLVENLMIQDVHTLRPDNTLREAEELMRTKNIRHIPIVTETLELVGLISEHDLKCALPSSLLTEQRHALNNRFIEEFMVTDVMVAHPLDFVEEMALLFFEEKISCLPIVSEGQLVGILTGTDILYTYIELTGAHKPSSQIELKVPDQVGTLHRVTAICATHRASIMSLLVYPDTKDSLKKIVSLRIKSISPQLIIEDLRKEGFELLWPNI
ncbi:acetoin utilization AcuB family protein [Kurthia senegalensis]|uniref:acetoin utilization AcuB family protein n=1 Tax=Kurthia senegalensis TaxID=1033740 RepID=UPI00028A13CE|nr:acetoin utilization AcuB family protein [Kurthia senegalensis]